MRRRLFPGLIALAVWLVVAAVLPAGAREPSIHKLGKRQFPLATTRLDARRKLLPVAYHLRANYAWSVCEIEGLGLREFMAHSSIQSINDLPVETVLPEGLLCYLPRADRYHFNPCAVNEFNQIDGVNSWLRDIDTEFKILERLANLIPSTNATGRIHMYTQLAPCASCHQVMCDFLDRYPNVTLQVFYREPYP